MFLLTTIYFYIHTPVHMVFFLKLIIYLFVLLEDNEYHV